MVKETKKDLTIKDPSAVPARVSGEKAAGFEEVDMQQDIIMPRLAVLQGLSALVIEGKGKMGQLANSVTKEIYGDSVEMIPLFLFKTRIMFEKGRGLVMMSRDGLTVSQTAAGYEKYLGKHCEDMEECQWHDNEPPEFSLVYNFPAILTGRLQEFPVSASFLRTGAKAGRTLISMAMMGAEDMFARKYRLSTEMQKNADNQTFAVPVIELMGRCNDEEYAAAKKWYSMLRGKPVEVEMEEEQPEY